MDAAVAIAEMYLMDLHLPATSVLMHVVVSIMQQPDNLGKGPATRREVASALLTYLQENPCSYLWLDLVDGKTPALVDVVEFYLWGNQSLDDILQLCTTRVCCELHIMATMVLLCAGNTAVRRLLSKRCTADILGPMIPWIMGQGNIQVELARMDIGYTGPLHITPAILLDRVVAMCCYGRPIQEDVARRIITHHLSILHDPDGRAWEVDRVTVQAMYILVQRGHIQTLPDTVAGLNQCMDDVILLLRDPEAFLFEQAQQQAQSAQSPAHHLDNVATSTVTGDLAGQSCTLCMEDFQLDEPVATLPCGHNFHQEMAGQCLGITMWLQGGTHCRGSGTCPLCLHRVDT
jgi:hypothetical protein